jgi:hypothetical protein
MGPLQKSASPALTPESVQAGDQLPCLESSEHLLGPGAVIVHTDFCGMHHYSHFSDNKTEIREISHLSRLCSKDRKQTEA